MRKNKIKLNEKQLTNLLQAGKILSSTLSTEDVLFNIMKIAMEIVNAEGSSILLLDEKTKELVFDVALGDKTEKIKHIRLKIGEGIAGWVAKEKKSVLVHNVLKDPRWSDKTDMYIEFKTKSVLAVPVIYKDKLIGVLEVVNKKNNLKFNRTDLQILETFASQSAISIETAKLFDNLKTEKEKIQLIFSQMSDAAMFIDTKGKILFSNLSCKNLLPEVKQDIFSTFEEFDINPDFNTILKTLSEKALTLQIEFSHKKRQFFLSGNISKIIDTKNNIVGFILIFRNTTEEKKEQILKRNFLSFISHKLRTPLVSIIGYSDLLLQSPNLSQQEKSEIETINKQGTYLSSLVDKLLNFTLIESEELKLEKSKFNFKELVQKVINEFKNSNTEPFEIVVSSDIEKISPVSADLEKIEIVLKNLLENALKFNNKKQKIINISKFETDNMVGLSVEDNGNGIPKEHHKKIFEKFSQIEESFTGQIKGIGLGLSLCKHIIEAHKGKIGFESQVDKGSKFYFVLPKE